jgi:hypothetical protein
MISETSLAARANIDANLDELARFTFPDFVALDDDRIDKACKPAPHVSSG